MSLDVIAQIKGKNSPLNRLKYGRRNFALSKYVQINTKVEKRKIIKMSEICYKLFSIRGQQQQKRTVIGTINFGKDIKA